MAVELTAPAKRRLPRWARGLLCVALFPVVFLAPLVVIGLWPGLQFKWLFWETKTPFGVGIVRDERILGIGAGILAFTWEHYSTGAAPIRALPEDLGELNCGGEHNRVAVIWRRR